MQKMQRHRDLGDKHEFPRIEVILFRSQWVTDPQLTCGLHKPKIQTFYLVLEMIESP